MYTNAFLLSLLPAAVLAANHDIKVGDGGLVYSPKTVTAAAGDTLTFTWSSGYHSVAQSSFDKPCSYMDGGVNSGVIMDISNNPKFVVTVKDTEPMWIYCSYASHCRQGMSMVVNGPSSGNTLDAYQKAAMSVSSVTQPGSVTGGTLSTGDDSSSSAASSMMMSSASSMAAESTSMMSSAMAASSTMMSEDMSSTMANAASMSATMSSMASATPSTGAAPHHVGEAVAVVGAAALALLI